MKQVTLAGSTTFKRDLIRSVSFNQDEIIRNIMWLYTPSGFELDPTYSKGIFYKHLEKPSLKFDIAPQTKDIQKADCRNLPIKQNSISSIMFDPPFVVGGTPSPKSKIPNRFGFFKTIQEMHTFYLHSFQEFYRILRDKGILVFKCQDTVSGGKQYITHVRIINQAEVVGFNTIDLFVLLAKNRMIGRCHDKQQHARKFHSYFIVFRKEAVK